MAPTSPWLMRVKIAGGLKFIMDVNEWQDWFAVDPASSSAMFAQINQPGNKVGENS
jgi:hypothetical protein